MNFSSHEVKTLDKGKEWFSSIKLTDLPIKVLSHTCSACGRTSGYIMNACGECVKNW